MSSAETIGIRTSYPAKRRPRRLALIRESIRRRRQARARRAHALRASGTRSRFVPGSEHTHILPRGRDF